MILALLAVTFTEASAQTAQMTSNSKFDIDKYAILAPMNDEIAGLCMTLKNETKIVIHGHHDSREYRKNSLIQNFGLSINRATEIKIRFVGCGIPAERIEVRGSWEAGDPRDVEGKESRTITILWGFRSIEEFYVSQNAYNDEMLRGLESIMSVAEEARDNSSEAATLAREARDASLRAEEASNRAARASEQTRDEVRNRLGNLFIRVGGSVNTSILLSGVSVGIGFQTGKRTDLSCEAYGEYGSHDRYLLERDDPINAILHWGTWYSVHCLVRYALVQKVDSVRSGVRFFTEFGPGLVHADYKGPIPSIGWNITALSTVLRGGVEVRSGPVGAELFVGENVYLFPNNRVDPTLATGKFAVGFHAGARVTLYL